MLGKSCVDRDVEFSVVIERLVLPSTMTFHPLQAHVRGHVVELKCRSPSKLPRPKHDAVGGDVNVLPLDDLIIVAQRCC